MLRDFVDWFDDPHLFLCERGAIDSAETARPAVAVERRSISETDARAYFRTRGARLDPIEGIWYDIPLHDGFRGVVDSLVNANRDALAHADRMIIDLRGNEGGGSATTESLEPFISLVAEKPNPFPTDGALMLSSDDQIARAVASARRRRRSCGVSSSGCGRILASWCRSTTQRLLSRRPNHGTGSSHRGPTPSASSSTAER